MRKVLITGASGFVAEHLIPKLRNLGFFVCGLDRKKHPSAECDKFFCADLVNLERDFFSGLEFDLVIHLAAARADWGISDEEFFRDNVLASEKLLAALDEANPKKIVFVSSIAVMPQGSNKLLDESAPNDPINAYGLSKLEAEKKFISYHRNKNNVDLSIIRPSVLYGPSDPKNTGIYRAVDNNIFRLIDGIYSNRFAIVGNGSTIKTTAYVKNFVESVLFAIERTKGYELFIYADQPPTPMIDLVKNIRANLGKRGEGPRLPFQIIRPLAIIFDLVSALTKINFPISQARVDTFVRPTNFKSANFEKKGFEQPYSTQEALAETTDWYLKLRMDERKSFFIFRDKDSQ